MLSLVLRQEIAGSTPCRKDGAWRNHGTNRDKILHFFYGIRAFIGSLASAFYVHWQPASRYQLTKVLKEKTIVISIQYSRLCTQR
jgi:hypothetical protein